jgi:hypothetical protein
MRTLLTGWFSFDHRGATVRDLIVRDVACYWLGRVGHSYDVHPCSSLLRLAGGAEAIRALVAQVVSKGKRCELPMRPMAQGSPATTVGRSPRTMS